MKKILITGGSGFFGSHLTELFIKKGYLVNVLDDFSSGKLENIKHLFKTKKLRVFKGSLGNLKILNKAMSRCEGVIHCATKNVRYSIKNPIETHNVNSNYSLKLFELALKKKIKKFIYCSSSEVYGNCKTKNKKLREFENFEPSTIYGATKLASEYYAKVYKNLYNLNIITIRPFNLFGERAHLVGSSSEVITRFFLNLMKRKPAYIYGKGNNERDFTYVRDAAKIFFKIYETKGRFKTDILNVGFGKKFSIIRLLNFVSKSIGIKKKETIFLSERPGDLKNLICDNRKLYKLYKIHPKTKLSTGLKKYYKWLSNIKKLPNVKTINW